jgi:hypothetical protein
MGIEMLRVRQLEIVRAVEQDRSFGRAARGLPDVAAPFERLNSRHLSGSQTRFLYRDAFAGAISGGAGENDRVTQAFHPDGRLSEANSL